MGDLSQGFKGIGSIFDIGGKLHAGKVAERQAEQDAAWMKRQAGVRRAETQREAIHERHVADLVKSRAQAVAAASGAGADDPTVTDILADIDAEGEYRALARLYVGEDEAKSLEWGAELRRREGRAAKRASRIAAVSSLFGSAYDMSQYTPKEKDSGFYGPPT